MKLHEDYEITLLTAEEYKAHKDAIPPLRCYWWLRSPGYYDDYASIVCDDGYVYLAGHSVYDDDVAVRPALKISDPDSSNLQIGDTLTILDNLWTYIGGGLAISKYLIAQHRYDSDNNDWETSELKAWLEDWAKERE